MNRRNITFIFLWLSSIAIHAADAQLVVYSSRSDKFVKPIMSTFTRQSGIEVVLHSGNSTALLNKLRLEKDRTKADLYLSNDAGNLQKASDLNLLKPISANLVQAIPERYRATDNTWIGLSARARVLVVNTQIHVADFVRSVFDLADPRLRGQLGITHSSNGSYIAGATVYLLKAGEKKTGVWLQGMKTNVEGSVYNKHSKIVKAVAEGKKAIGLVNHYYIYRHLDKYPNAPIKIVLPDQDHNGMGVAWNVAGIGITRYSNHAKAAEKLIAFLVSEQGQKYFAELNREYPTRVGIAAASEVPPAGSFKVANVPMSALGHKRNVTLDLIESVGMP